MENQSDTPQDDPVPTPDPGQATLQIGLDAVHQALSTFTWSHQRRVLRVALAEKDRELALVDELQSMEPRIAEIIKSRLTAETRCFIALAMRRAALDGGEANLGDANTILGGNMPLLTGGIDPEDLPQMLGELTDDDPDRVVLLQYARLVRQIGQRQECD